MIKEGILYYGGNKFYFWLGNLFKKWSDKLLKKGKVKIISNPVAKLINPFTVIINFTIDGSEKYQLVMEGDFKEKYKENDDGDPKIGEKELLMTINSFSNKWFKKE